jgi:hypothetical protein
VLSRHGSNCGSFKNMLKKILKNILYWFLAIVAFAVLIILILSLNGLPSAQPPYTLGATFRYTSARDLGLDWKKIYLSSMTDLGIKNWRIPAYWEEIEPKKNSFDFSNLDFQVNQAAAHGSKIILVVGRRVPGWPECHMPSWASAENFDQQQKDLTDEITKVVNRYKDNSALQFWQVENEPFLTRFGVCPKYDVAGSLDQEIALVRGLDPKHQIIVTDSGELSIWLRAADRADVFGSTLYRKVYAEKLFHRYIDYHWPAIFFKAKEGLVRLFNHNKPIINIELQAEPWTTKGIGNTSFEEQSITYPPGALTANLEFAHNSGFSTTYFWGVEYWYWAADHGHPEFLKEAKTIISNNQK